MPASESTLTELLTRAALGDRAALDAAYQRVYPDLHRLARSRLRAHERMTLLDTTSLVHECFLRFVNNERLSLEDRRHFFAYAATTMRSIIVDMAREHLAQRRGGGAEDVRLDTVLLEHLEDGNSSRLMVRINDALLAIEEIDPSIARVVEMRYFAGYSEEEIAEINGCSVRTVRRQWEKARAYLAVQLKA